MRVTRPRSQRTHLGRVWGAEKIASIDPEEFYDFQAVRPQVELVDGLTRKIVWPANEFSAARARGPARRDPPGRDRTQPSLEDVQRGRRRRCAALRCRARHHARALC